MQRIGLNYVVLNYIVAVHLGGEAHWVGARCTEPIDQFFIPAVIKTQIAPCLFLQVSLSVLSIEFSLLGYCLEGIFKGLKCENINPTFISRFAPLGFVIGVFK